MQSDLRPLGIGEILDRAVTLLARRFAVIILILALVAIPVAICQYIAAPRTTAMLDDLRRVLAVPPGHTRQAAAAIGELLGKNRVGQAGLGLVVISMVLSALSSCACVIAIAQAYAGKLPSVREVYRQALRRWFSQIVALVFFCGLACAIFLGLFIIVVVVALVVGKLAGASGPLAMLIGIPAAVIAGLVLFGVGAVLYFAAEMSFVSIALEDPNPIRGIAQGLRRTLSPPVFWRSVLVAIIVFVIMTVGDVVLLLLAGTTSALTHLTALYPIVAVLGGVVLNALITTFVVVYAIDIRVRREGYDLALAAREPLR